MNDLIPPAEKFRTDAGRFREYGGEGSAEMLEACAEYCEQYERERGEDELTLTQGARACRKSYSWIQKRVAAGEIPNVGKKGKPRVRRGDLPVNGKRTPTIDLLRA